MPVDIRFLRFLSPEFLMHHPDLLSIRMSDADNNQQIDQNEAEIAVIRDSLFSQMGSPPDLSNPQVAEQLSQVINQIRQEQNQRDQGRELQRVARQYLDSAEQLINRVRRTELDLTPLANAPRTAGVMIPELEELRRINADGNRSLTQAEVETYLRHAREQAASAQPGGTTPSPAAPSAEDSAAQAQAFLSSTAAQLLEQLTHLDTGASTQADQIPTSLYQLDLSSLPSLTDEQRLSHPLLRILTWMRAQTGNETLLTSDRAHELLNEHAFDLFPLALGLMQMPTPPQDLADFIRTYSPHFIVTEAQLETYLQGHRLNFSSLPASVMSQGAIQILYRLAGDDHILTRDDVIHFRESSLATLRHEHPDQPLPTLGELHFAPLLHEQFQETQRRNELHGQLIGEAEWLPLEAEVFLSRAAVVLAYTLPAQAESIVEQTRTSGALSLAYLLANGLHEEERAHASDSLPGIGNMLFSGVTSPGALVEGLGNLIFSSSHRFQSGIWNYQWNREWVRNHADRRHQERMGALHQLRRIVSEHHLTSLSEGIDYLRQHESNGRVIADWLTQELHIPEMERIFHIENSREQEEAWLGFCGRLREGQGVNWHGDLRSLLLSPWQNHNGPATLSLYQQLVNQTPNHMIYESARAAGLDQVGNGGSLFPAFWFRDWADSEASFDGLWDEIGATTILMAATYGIGNLFQWARTPGSLTSLPPEEWRSAASILTRGRYWTTRGLTAAPRFLSALPPDEWRSSESLLRRGGYWSLRGTGAPFRFLFPRSLVGREADLAIEEGLRWAQAAERGGLRGFFYRQMAQLRAASLSAHPDTAVGAEHVLRLSNQITERSTQAFEALTRETQEALRVMETNPVRAQEMLRGIRRRTRGVAGLYEVALNAQISSGVHPEGLAAAEHLDTAAEDVMHAARRLRSSDPGLARSLTRIAEGIRFSAGRSAVGEIAQADRLMTAAQSLDYHGAMERQRGMMGMGLIVWAWLYERALSDADRRNPAELTLPMAGIDGAAIEGVRRRARRTRGSRAIFEGFSLSPVPSYREAPEATPPPPPPPPPEE
jgi:hypothetical protein